MGNIRRQRGYTWEKSVEKFFNNIDLEERNNRNKLRSEFWNARRLFPPLPDVMVTYQDLLFFLEAKSTAKMEREVELRQIENQDTFDILLPKYQELYLGICWKFMSKTQNKRARKKIRTFIILWHSRDFKVMAKILKEKDVPKISCKYDGTIRFRTNQTLSQSGVSQQDRIDEIDFNQYMNESFGKRTLRFNSLEKMSKYFKNIYE